MAIVTSQDGRRAILGFILPLFSTLEIRLFANDFTPGILSQFSDFVEPAYDTYAPIPLANWSGVFWTEGLTARSNADPVIFSVGPDGGSDMIYGYWVTDSAGRVLWSERNPAGPEPMADPGAIYPVTPRYEIGTLCP